MRNFFFCFMQKGIIWFPCDLHVFEKHLDLRPNFRILFMPVPHSSHNKEIKRGQVFK